MEELSTPHENKKRQVCGGVGSTNVCMPYNSQQGDMGNENRARLTHGHGADQRQTVQLMTHPALEVRPSVSSSTGTLLPSFSELWALMMVEEAFICGPRKG